MDRPFTIQIAAILFLISVLAGLPSLLINATYAPAEQSRPVIIVLGVILLGLYLLLGYLMYRRKNWARILFSVLSILGFIMMFTQDPVGQHHIYVKYIGWFQSVLTVVVFVLLFMPQSNTWFSKRSLDEA